MVWKIQRTRSGETISMDVNPKIRVEVLELIRKNLLRYDNPEDFKFTLDEYLEEKYSFLDYRNRPCERERLKRLVKSGWLSCQKNSEKKLVFSITKRFRKYLDSFGMFNNPDSPLMKPRTKIIERRIEIDREVERNYKRTVLPKEEV